MPNENKVREFMRRQAAANSDRRRDKVEPLKPARSKAEITRVRQGWGLIALSITNIVLVWATRH